MPDLAPELLPGNRLTLLNSGQAYFPALLAELDAARLEIRLESYIFAHDRTGTAVCAALCRAAERGVRVYVLVDGFGARNFPDDFAPQLTASGVRNLLFRQEIAPFRLRRHRLRRLHRKLVVVDHRVAFVGGINIIDDHNTAPAMAPRYDYAVRVEGPVVTQIEEAMLRLWNVVVWASLKRRPRLRELFRPPCPELPTSHGPQAARFLIRDNIRHRNDIINAYIDALQQAREEVLIANAYFLPGVRFGQALLAAVRRGVRVTILLQGQTDHPLLHFATQTLYATLLRSGIRILEYKKSFMHAKVAVIDRQWATVGSSNIDPFSLLLAREGNLVVLDPVFAGQLRASLETAMAEGAEEMQLEALQRLPFWSRGLRWLSYALVRLLVGLTGYGPRHWQANEETRHTQQYPD